MTPTVLTPASRTLVTPITRNSRIGARRDPCSDSIETPFPATP
jgi:hypothetical protein